MNQQAQSMSTDTKSISRGYLLLRSFLLDGRLDSGELDYVLRAYSTAKAIDDTELASLRSLLRRIDQKDLPEDAWPKIQELRTLFGA